jgi:hypothetical protein
LATGTNGAMQRRASGSFKLPPAAWNFFVHISAVERAGMRDLNEGQKIPKELSLTSAPANPQQTFEAGVNLKARENELQFHLASSAAT